MMTVRALCSSTQVRTRCANSPGRKLGRIDLLDDEVAAILQRGEVDAEALGALEQQAELLVEDEHGRALAAGDRLHREGAG